MCRRDKISYMKVRIKLCAEIFRLQLSQKVAVLFKNVQPDDVKKEVGLQNKNENQKKVEYKCCKSLRYACRNVKKRAMSIMLHVVVCSTL